MNAPIIISLLALVIALILPVIGIYNFFINRKIYADFQDNYYLDKENKHKSKTLIVLSTKGTSPIYYKDYRIIKYNCRTGVELVLINEDDIPPTNHPGVIKSAEPKIIENHGFSTFPSEIKGEKIKYKIELLITGRKKSTILSLRKQNWENIEYDYGNNQFDWPLDEEE